MISRPNNSDGSILKDIGEKLVARRVVLKFTQAELAYQAGVSKHTIERLENGESVQMANFIRTIRALGLVERLALMFPERESPLAQLREQKKPRKRVRKKRAATIAKEKENWKWGESS